MGTWIVVLAFTCFILAGGLGKAGDKTELVVAMILLGFVAILFGLVM